MQTKRILAKGILCALAIAVIPAVAASAQNITPGSACKVLNQKISSQNKSHTCIKSGKKLIWNQGVVQVKPAAPIATSAPISTSASVDAPAPSSELETPTPGATCSRNKNSLKNC
jgi:hypothetical protein